MSSIMSYYFKRIFSSQEKLFFFGFVRAENLKKFNFRVSIHQGKQIDSHKVKICNQKESFLCRDYFTSCKSVIHLADSERY